MPVYADTSPNCPLHFGSTLVQEPVKLTDNVKTKKITRKKNKNSSNNNQNSAQANKTNRFLHQG